MREIVIGGAQMGPIQRADTREAVVARMIALWMTPIEPAAKSSFSLNSV